MNIIILGAGRVGGTLAKNLSGENKNIVVVDDNPEKLRTLQERLDIKTVLGKATYPDILALTDPKNADLLIAVTESDETNMIACQIAHSMFGVPKNIARIRSSHYTNCQGLFNPEVIPVDVLISPEKVVTMHIYRLIEHPGALQVLEFAEGKVALVGVRVSEGSTLAQQKIATLKDHMPNLETRVAAIFRKNHPIHPTGDTAIETGDEVFFVAAQEHIQTILSNLREGEKQYKRIIIAGGGNIGLRLAQVLERASGYAVKIIETHSKRTEKLCNELEHTVVLHGDAASKELLLEENIENTELFIAVTNDDEANIMSSLLAKRLGAHKVMALISNSAYVDLIDGQGIDIAISPQQASISSLLMHVRRGDLVNVYSLRRGAAEAVEVIAHGTEETSKVIGRTIDDLKLPTGTTIGAIVRNNNVIIAHDNTVIESEDHIILFLIDKQKITEVEDLFQVEITL